MMRRWIFVFLTAFCFLAGEWAVNGTPIANVDNGFLSAAWAKSKKKGKKKKDKDKGENEDQGEDQDEDKDEDKDGSKGTLSKKTFDYCATGWLNFDKDLTAKDVKAYCSCESDYLIKTEKLTSQDVNKLQQLALDPQLNDETLIEARIRAFEACRDLLGAKVLKKLNNNTGF